MYHLTPRERIIRAIQHKTSDIVPWNIEMTSGFAEKMQARFPGQDPELCLGNHMLRIKYKKTTVCDDGESIDLFGVKWKKPIDGGDVGIVSYSPLESEEDGFGEYRFPDVNKDFALSICDKLEAEKERFTMFSITMGFFERAWSLRGMENALMDMVLEPEFAQEMYDRILEHHLTLLDTVLDRKFDAVYFGDDWGQQKGLIMGPEYWRRFIKPGVKRIFETVKSKGKYVVLHSCGDLREILPDLIEMGVDVYNTVQPEIYDLRALKAEYGRDLCFYGGISTQQFLPYATVPEVTEKTLEILRIMDGGGYILSPTHAVTPDIPIENVQALIQANNIYHGIT